MKAAVVKPVGPHSAQKGSYEVWLPRLDLTIKGG